MATILVLLIGPVPGEDVAKYQAEKVPHNRKCCEDLKEEYEIYAVRGPQGIPNSLSSTLNR